MSLFLTELFMRLNFYLNTMISLNNISMKPKKSVKNQEHKILGEEAQKIKDKLEQLKEQIKRKKQQKQMSRTSNTIYSQSNHNRTSVHSRLNSAHNSQILNRSLLEALREMKMEGMVDKLKQNNVRTLEDLRAASPQKIDKWTNIPVGYRIKLKKFVAIAKQRTVSEEEKIDLPSIHQQSSGFSGILDIQSIVEHRKVQNIFIPIKRQNDVGAEQEYQEIISEGEEEEMIISIMQTLRPKKRPSCLRNKSKKKEKHVHWSADVEKMEKQHSHLRSYPKEKITKELFHLETPQITSAEEISLGDEKQNKEQQKIIEQEREFPDYKYCWICLKFINEVKLSLQARNFCSQKCMNAFSFSLKQSFQDRPEKQNTPREFNRIKQEQEEQLDRLSFDIL